MCKMNSVAADLRYTPADLFRMQKYIAEQTPILFYFDLKSYIRQFIVEGFIPNLFQTDRKGKIYSQRKNQYESYLFQNCYKHNTDGDSVKYALINLANSSKGIKYSTSRQESFIVMKKNVRERCTIVNKRKFQPGQVVATLKYCNAVMSQFTSYELNATFYSSQGFQMDIKYQKLFKEVHIHGPVSFYEDVEKMYVPSFVFYQNQEALKIFNNKFGVPVYPIE